MIPKSSASLKRCPDTKPAMPSYGARVFQRRFRGSIVRAAEVSWVFLYFYALSKYAFRKFQRRFDDRRIATGDGLSAGQRGVECFREGCGMAGARISACS